MVERSCAYLHAVGALGPNADLDRSARVKLQSDPPARDLRELSKRTLGQTLRQASHFAMLAAVGARACLGRVNNLSPDTAIYLGTGLGEVRAIEALFKQVMPPGPGLAAPYDFINANNNMAGFYVARLAGLTTRNLTITEDAFSFEFALSLALADLAHDAIPAALVGGVDENSHPRASHLRRLPLRDDQIMGEGSAWLYLNREHRDALGKLWVETLAIPGASAAAWAQETAQFLSIHDIEDATLLPGYGLLPEEVAALLRSLPGLGYQPYLDYCGCYPTAAAFGIATIFDSAQVAGKLYLHINRSAGGSTMVIGLSTLAPATG